MNINNLFGQNQPPQQPQMPQYQPQQMPPQYWQQPQQPQPQYRPQQPQFQPPKVKVKAKKRGVRKNVKKIFRITKLEIFTVGVIILCFGWYFMARSAKKSPSVEKAATKVTVSHKKKSSK